MSDAILFDRDQVERLDDLSDRPRRLSGSKLLWVDIDRASDENARTGSRRLSASTTARASAWRTRTTGRSSTTTAATSTSPPTPRSEEDEGKLISLECVVGENWVVTAHDEPVPVLEEFAQRVSGSGDTGSLDGPKFLAALLEWVLGSYSSAFERIEQRLEEFDIQAMRGDGDEEKDIERLIDMRKEVGNLRRALAAHRSALVSLTYPELEALGDHASSERFRLCSSRFESTVQEARDAREAIVGSFDVLIARGGHRTNEIMKVLTLTSVILLPGALHRRRDGDELQGRPLRQPVLFWVVLAVIVAIGPVAIGLAKRWDWI